MQKNKELEFICQKVHFFRLDNNAIWPFNLGSNEIAERFRQHPFLARIILLLSASMQDISVRYVWI